MPTPPATTPPSQQPTDPPHAGPWVIRWLSPPRHAVYLTAAGGDAERALALYDWNAQLSAALLRDLAHLEVALRNAYDRALSAWRPNPHHWTTAGQEVFAPVIRTRNRRHVDINQQPRDALRKALAAAGGPTAAPGKVVAELMFGFWRFLSSAAHEKTLWVPCLHHAFPPGTDRRRDVDGPIGRLHDLRNRVARHEPLLRTDIGGRLQELLGVAALLDRELGQYLAATTSVGVLAAQRP